MNLSKPHDIWTGLRFKSCCKLPSEANLQGRCQDQADDSQHDLYEQAQPAQSNAARVQELLLLQKAAPQGLQLAVCEPAVLTPSIDDDPQYSVIREASQDTQPDDDQTQPRNKGQPHVWPEGAATTEH